MQGYEVQQSSTAYPLCFLLILSSDHITGATGLSPTVTISKNGGAFAGPSGAVTEIANGWYKVAGNATDTGTLGPILLHATGTGTDPVDMMFAVVAVNPQSAAYGLSLAKTTNITGFNDIAASAIVSNGAITTSSGKVSEVALVDTLTTYTGDTPQTGDSFARIGSTGSGLTSLAPASTALSTAVWTATLAGYIGNLSGGAVALESELLMVLAAVDFIPTSNPTAAAIATTVWGDLVAGGDFGTAGSIGKLVATTGAPISLTQTLGAARALDAVADTSITVNDALQCAVGSIAAQMDASGGTTLVIKTASTGTTLRTKTLTLVDPPTTVPDKAV